MHEDDYLMMSGIQHFCFCRRQWALIHLEQQWNENMLTAEGRIIHSRSHDASILEKRKDLITVRALKVTSHRLKLSGECDVVEFRRDDNGITIHYAEGLWAPMPVEYKHGASKLNDADRLQLCAQVMALEEMLMCTINNAAIYYAKTHSRENVIIDDCLRSKTQAMANEMWNYFQQGYTPKVKTGKQCKSCSLVDICLPVLCKDKSVNKYISSLLEST